MHTTNGVVTAEMILEWARECGITLKRMGISCKELCAKWTIVYKFAPDENKNAYYSNESIGNFVGLTAKDIEDLEFGFEGFSVENPGLYYEVGKKVYELSNS